MTEHPNATDYANKYQREAAYWREMCETIVNVDPGTQEWFEAFTGARDELARINAEALR